MGLDIKGLWHKVRALASSNRRSRPMDSNGKLLSDLQAAEFLQPFLLHKNAAQWLASDRQQNPVISFLLINGQPFYAGMICSDSSTGWSNRPRLISLMACRPESTAERAWNVAAAAIAGPARKSRLQKPWNVARMSNRIAGCEASWIAAAN